MHKNSPFSYKKLSGGGGTAPSPDPTSLGAFSVRPPVPLSDGLDNRRCKILDPPLHLAIGTRDCVECLVLSNVSV